MYFLGLTDTAFILSIVIRITSAALSSQFRFVDIFFYRFVWFRSHLLGLRVQGKSIKREMFCRYLGKKLALDLLLFVNSVLKGFCEPSTCECYPGGVSSRSCTGCLHLLGEERDEIFI